MVDVVVCRPVKWQTTNDGGAAMDTTLTIIKVDDNTWDDPTAIWIEKTRTDRLSLSAHTAQQWIQDRRVPTVWSTTVLVS